MMFKYITISFYHYQRKIFNYIGGSSEFKSFRYKYSSITTVMILNNLKFGALVNNPFLLLYNFHNVCTWYQNNDK